MYKAGLFSREIASLAKLYTSTETKYLGTNNNFNYKFKIFLDHYKQAGVPKDSLVRAVSIMLKDQALDYYFTYKFRSQTNYTIKVIYKAIKNYFKGLEHQINALQQ